MKALEGLRRTNENKGRYGANKQVRASSNARKWKRMIEYVTISLLVLGALMEERCLHAFSGPNRAFLLFATKTVRGPKPDRAPSAMRPPACWNMFDIYVHVFRR